MRKQQYVQDITANAEVSGPYLIASANLSQSRNGPFWRLELRDASGSVDAKIWSPLSQQFPELAPGRIAEVEGRAATYRDRLDITISRMRLLDDDEQSRLDLGLFLPASPRPAREMLDELIALAKKELRHKPWRKFALSVLQDEAVVPLLLTAPAAKSVHHAYTGGLLEHTLSVVQLCLGFCAHYPELDRETLLAGALFHDLGKIWELTGGLANDYSDQGRLIGHIELALSYLAPRLERAGVEPGLALHFRHLLLSHHGEYEYGSPRRPKTAEGMALHYADNLDAKIAQCRAALSGLDEDEQGWSPWQGTLQRALFRPQRTPTEAETPKKAAKPAPREQVLTLPGLDGGTPPEL